MQDMVAHVILGKSKQHKQQQQKYYQTYFIHLVGKYLLL